MADVTNVSLCRHMFDSGAICRADRGATVHNPKHGQGSHPFLGATVDTFVCQTVVRVATHGCVGETDIICGKPKDHHVHGDDRSVADHEYTPSYRERQAIEATFEDTQKRYNLEMMQEADVLMREALSKAKQARDMMQHAGMTPGLGLDTWSGHVVSYGAQIVAQLKALIRIEIGARR